MENWLFTEGFVRGFVCGSLFIGVIFFVQNLFFLGKSKSNK